MPTTRTTLLTFLLGTVLLGCSGKSSLKATLDGSLTEAGADTVPAGDSATDVARTADLPREASLPDLAVEVAGAAEVPLGTVDTADLPPDRDAEPDAASDGASTKDTMAVPDGLPDLARDIVSGDACQVVANATFVSVDEHECGRTPTGVAMCNWSIVFTDNGASRQLSWRSSDTIRTLDYQCNGLTITAATFTGSLDPVTGIHDLPWRRLRQGRSLSKLRCFELADLPPRTANVVLSWSKDAPLTTVSLSAGQEVSLARLTDRAGRPFPGVDDTGLWLFSLTCGSCRNPAPWFLSVLRPRD